MGYSPWGHKESDTTEHAHTHLRYFPLRFKKVFLDLLIECQASQYAGAGLRHTNRREGVFPLGFLAALRASGRKGLFGGHHVHRKLEISTSLSSQLTKLASSKDPGSKPQGQPVFRETQVESPQDNDSLMLEK